MAKAGTYDRHLEGMTRRHVVGVLREILSDPDFGLLLRENVVQRLKRSIQSKKIGKQKSLDAVLRKYSS